MKYTGILPVYLLLPVFLFAQGSDCSNPHAIPIDGQCNSYSISNTTGTALHCTSLNSLYDGTGRLTIFSFTPASSACVLINLTTSGNQPAEVLLFTACSGGGNLNANSEDELSSICFNDGTGLWAPSKSFTMVAGTTYYLRVWTPGPGSITMCANYYTPPNNLCSGATAIGTVSVTDNNACHVPSTEVTAGQLCAFSIENTAFYNYTTDYEGSSILTISNIACDNSALSGKGFQIGFFTGTCGALIPLTCYRDTGVLIQAVTPSIPAGTNVVVAIDGMLGSNCTYTVSVINGVTSLPASLKYFSAWETPDANLLKWLTVSELPGAHFEIEKSTDGFNYYKIGMLEGKNHTNAETNYSFEDKTLNAIQFYRLKMISGTGRGSYSNTIQLKRMNLSQGSVAFQKIAADKVLIKANMANDKNTIIQIIDASGRQMKLQNMKLEKGENSYEVDIHSLYRGFYYLVLSDSHFQKQFSFIKE